MYLFFDVLIRSLRLLANSGTSSSVQVSEDLPKAVYMVEGLLWVFEMDIFYLQLGFEWRAQDDLTMARQKLKENTKDRLIY